ncbi:MAG: multidrug ABC transporter ATP-binding protein [Firmicutes bacterium HGW-Firmicutes-12]|nr:MAG: multidrug ABC transporter ATP-binding protein [Firmicutes bacterium HGW-Firmicutes-12]
MLKLICFLKAYRKSIFFVLVLVFFQSFSQLYLPTLLSDIVDVGIVQGDTDYILKIGVIMLLVAAGGTICSVVANYLSSQVATGFAKDIRRKVFSHVESYSLHNFNKIGTASLITRTTNDITQVQQVTLMILRMMVSAPMMCIGGIIMAVSQDAKLSLLLIVVIPLITAIILVVSRKSLPLFKLIQVKLDKLNLVLRERLTGIRVIRAFNRTEYEKARFVDANADLTNTAIKVNRIMAVLMPTMMLIMNFTTIAIIWFGGLRIEAGEMQVGSLMAYIQYVMQILFSLLMVSMMFVMIPRASASAIRVNEILEITNSIKDPEKKDSAIIKSGLLEFRNVTFSYPGAEQPALKNISFQAKPGEVTAIIGSTGSGKSTLINLIPRFFDIDSGSILVDGTNILDLSQENLRKEIGFVPQKALLFTGTVNDNIKHGKKEATKEEIQQAAITAQAEEFINSMTDGYNSLIAQGGINLSGGQKQRLSIARALVRKPRIYLFDDSFSALDYKTDAKLRAALKDETADATVMIVAQRVNTIMNADKIIVLDEGQIVGMGPHQELIKNCEIYREIVSSQLSEEVIA